MTREINLSANDGANDIVGTDTGYALAGTTCDGDSGGINGLLLHLTASGERTWHRSYGKSKRDKFRAITQTADGGFFLGGENEPESDRGLYWMIKTSATSGQEWSRMPSLRGGYLFDVTQPPSGDFVIAGFEGPRPSSALIVNLCQPD